MAETRLFWTDKDEGRIESSALDGSDRLLVKDGVPDPRGIAYEPIKKRIYYASHTADGGIRSMDVDGEFDLTRVAGLDNVADIAFGPDFRWLYVVTEGTDSGGDPQPNSGAILRFNQRVGGLEELGTSLDRPYYLAVSDDESTVYWAAFNSGVINRINIGSGISTPFITGQARVRDLEIADGFLYWTDRGTSEIRRRAIDGTGTDEILFSGSSDGLDRPHGMILDPRNQTIYWTDTRPGKVSSGSIDGAGDVTSVATSALNGPWALALVDDDFDLYASWQDRYFTAAELRNPALEATIWGADADPDGDGSSNLVEYAQLTDPLRADSVHELEVIPAIVPNQDGVRLLTEVRVRQGDPNLSFVLRTSDNLVEDDWRDASPIFRAVSPTENEDLGYDLWDVVLPETFAERRKAFVRVDYRR